MTTISDAKAAIASAAVSTPNSDLDWSVVSVVSHNGSNVLVLNLDNGSRVQVLISILQPEQIVTRPNGWRYSV